MECPMSKAKSKELSTLLSDRLLSLQPCWPPVNEATNTEWLWDGSITLQVQLPAVLTFCLGLNLWVRL